MSISIVLAIHNGAKFLEELIDSLLNQSREINEFIIIDDASSDDSIHIIERKLKTKNHKIFTNNKNLGPVKSFEIGITKASGDLIFLCDQDDKWKPHKVEAFNMAFNEGNDFVFSDANLIDHEGNLINQSFLEKLNLSIQDKILLTEKKADVVLAKKNVVSGACCAFRNSALHKNYLPLVNGIDNLLHDRQLASLFAASDPSRFHFIPENLIEYRIHDKQYMGFNDKENSQESSSTNISKVEYFLQEAEIIQHILEKVENNHFRRAHYFWFMRSQAQKLPFMRKFVSLNTLLLEGDYKRYTGKGMRMFLSDLF